MTAKWLRAVPEAQRGANFPVLTNQDLREFEPSFGLCGAEPFEPEKLTLLGCLAPFCLPARTVPQFDNGQPVEELGSNSYSPYPAEFGISPMSTSRWQLPNQPGAAAVVFTTMQPLAHVRRELDIPSLRLAKFTY